MRHGEVRGTNFKRKYKTALALSNISDTFIIVIIEYLTKLLNKRREHLD